MNARDAVNRALDRATGHQLIKTSSLASFKSASEKAARVSAPKPAPKPAPPKRPAGALPADYDQDTLEIWDLVRRRTMTGHPKVHFLTEAVRYVVRNDIPGAMLECGVWRGGSMLAVAHSLQRLGVTDRDLYLFDTFTGMSEPTERDVHLTVGKSAEDILVDRDSGGPIWRIATLEDVQEGFAEIDYPAERIHYVPGKVEDTIPGEAPDQIAILRLDTDWYESTKHELAHLYSRLAPGGVLIIDDYGSWQGSKDATDEFLLETGEPLMLTRVARGRVAIKPGLSTRI
jgi:O-methyltransferase